MRIFLFQDVIVLALAALVFARLRGRGWLRGVVLACAPLVMVGVIHAVRGR